MRRLECKNRRPGFTLIELLVATAVSLLLMVILTEAFKRGIDMFRTLRAQGQLQEKARNTSQTMRDDLAGFHFLDATNSNNVAHMYLSGYDFRPSATGATVDAPPADGYFRIYQGPEDVQATPYIAEGTDPEGIVFSRARTHMLAFTVFRRETSPTVKNPVDPSYMFQVDMNGIYGGERLARPGSTSYFPRDYVSPAAFQVDGRLASRWGEVAYFLAPNGNSAGGTPLYNLHRRVKAVLPAPLTVTGASPPYQTTPAPAPNNMPQCYGPGYIENPEVSARAQISGGQQGRFYNFSGSVTQPRNRTCMGPAVNANDPYSAGLIYPNQPPNGPPFAITPWPPAPGPVPVGGPYAIPQNSGMPTTYRTLAQDLPNGLNDPKAGDDILLSDVLSFEVKVNWDAPPLLFTGGLPDPWYVGPPAAANLNPDWPFDYLPLSPQNLVLADRGIRVFDTWSTTQFYGTQWNATGASAPDQTGARMPLRIRVKALQIKIRVWDAKAEQTRQITIIQDM